MIYVSKLTLCDFFLVCDLFLVVRLAWARTEAVCRALGPRGGSEHPRMGAKQPHPSTGRTRALVTLDASLSPIKK